MKINRYKHLDINVFPTRIEMGLAAGRDVESMVVRLLKVQDEVRMVFAAAPSQNEMLDYLAASQVIEWDRITAFHMDEYIGLNGASEQLFSKYLERRLFSRVRFRNVHLIDGNANPRIEAERYAALITEAPLDIICLGIGENGHIAFNDPPVADFNDPRIVKKVTLDRSCRMQQVNEGCFTTLGEVPEKALTLTIPVIFGASHLYCVVPGLSKREAVHNTINGPVTTACPASVLQNHTDCSFYFDSDSFGDQENM
ncbi:MAG: 6-phosphogluconolactonase [Bacteroidales bacterium]|jgi:glucosamine-6-phosphate deaminase|nr:6-phosphogluconolactonase [Bacteroidales bacterium]MCB9029391.1 6-phosphogluconolactonase [Bacteroidales bacterium]HOO66466.1 6-phosphogluconolactonase [Bacteroidales bacterium]HPE22854.1 6-phosphogluconolactonase [Bacteroidales bacterium]HPJ05400.1 6-phosphogluconolactonase [Bacteroidales bacterium]